MERGILFVCLGNICRSAAAEAVMKRYLRESGREEAFRVDSAGTAGYHEGEPADPRMIEVAGQRGYEVDSVARKIRLSDLDAFDLILTMDQENYRHVMRLCSTSEQRRKVRPFIDFVSEKTRSRYGIDCVPDPYYGGRRGFDQVLDILEDAMPAIVQEIGRDISGPAFAVHRSGKQVP